MIPFTRNFHLMKLISFAIILFSTNVFAKSPTLELEINMISYAVSDPEMAVQSDLPQLRLKWYNNNFYLFGSVEWPNIYYSGQESINMTVVGAGYGYRYEFAKKYAISFEAGYYHPMLSDPKSGRHGDEGHEYYMNKAVGEKRHFREYWTETTCAPGAAIKIEANPNKWTSLYIGYRYLVMKNNLYGRTGKEFWTLRRSLDLSGFVVGASVGF